MKPIAVSFLDEISSLGDLLTETSRGASHAIDVALPAQVVEAYDPARNSVTVKPLLNGVMRSPDGGYVGEERPEIYDVPVAWPSFGGFQITFPIAVNDVLLILVPDYDVQAWRTSGQRTDPGDCRPHHIAGAIALPLSLRTLAQPMQNFNASLLEMGHATGLRVAFTLTQMQVGGATDAAALASKVDALAAAFNTFRTGYASHTHTDPVSGSTGAPSFTGAGYSGGASASARLKVGG